MGLGITAINLAAIASSQTVNGNSIAATSTVTFADGNTTQIAEALFDISQMHTHYRDRDVNALIPCAA